MLSPYSDISQYKSSTPINKLKLPFGKEDVYSVSEGLIEKSMLKQLVKYLSENYNKQIIVQELDKCQDTVQLVKFMEIVQMGQVQNPQSRSAEELFKLYDRDGKGYIDKDDLMRVAQITGIQLSKKQIQEMIDFKATPGRVQYHQFAEIMNDQNFWF